MTGFVKCTQNVRSHVDILPDEFQACIHLHIEPADDLLHKVRHSHVGNVLGGFFVQVGGLAEPLVNVTVLLHLGYSNFD